MTFTAYDDAVIVQYATDYLRGREGLLVLLGLERDGSDLDVSVKSISRVQPIPKAERDHPMDYATIFFYADVNGYIYRFAFDDCGKILDAGNLSGFDVDLNDL